MILAMHVIHIRKFNP